MKVCPFCSEQIQDAAVKCRYCKSWIDGGDPNRDEGWDDEPEHSQAGLLEMALLPVGRSGWAIAAGYLGLVSIACIPAPIALLVSIRALRDLRENPHLGGAGRAYFGLVMGILFTIPFAYMAFIGVTGRR